VVLVGCSDASTKSVPAMQVAQWFKRFIRDAATCLDFAEPLFTVDVEMRVWSMGSQGALGLKWKDEDDNEVIRGIAKSIIPIESKLHRVCDLLDKGGKPSAQRDTIGARAAEHLKLIATAQSDFAML
jgi:hypothetical protein